jgi:archaellum biogenesis protein FlaJ (TadC family)
MRATPATLFLLLVAFLAVGSVLAAHPMAGPITITPVSPVAGGTTSSTTPNISATFTDTGGQIDPSNVYVSVDGANVTGLDTVVITSNGFYYNVPSILRLTNGNHTVTVVVADSQGHQAEYSWGFYVNTSASSTVLGLSFNLGELLVEIAVGAGVVAAAFGGYILYLKQTQRFTFRKYFATHPVNKAYLVLYVPLAVAFVVVLLGLLYVYSTPGMPLLAPEYVFIVGVFIALTAFAIDARAERQRTRAYERAFAQFLFEMADAMRGGLDPAKALVELSRTHTNILRKPLRIAADGIRVGRPFDYVLKSMVAPIRSSLISRYAELIADASSVGGETSAVVHRAAKDMDDFIKIESERNTALVMPVAVMYVAFGVLMAVLFSLLSIAPSLGSVSLSFFSVNPLSQVGSHATSTVPKLGVDTLRQRFFDLMMINAIGTGVIIGAFTEGKARYGLLHSLGLLAVTVVAFLIIAP